MMIDYMTNMRGWESVPGVSNKIINLSFHLSISCIVLTLRMQAYISHLRNNIICLSFHISNSGLYIKNAGFFEGNLQLPSSVSPNDHPQWNDLISC